MIVKRRRLRVDRIVIVLALLVGLFYLIKFGIYTIKNFRIYNSAKNSSTIYVSDSKLNIWNKTIDYLKENKQNISISYKGDVVTINTKDLKNGMNIKLDGYNKTIDEPLFNEVESYYIKSNDILNLSSRLEISLPSYLSKYDIVDVYKVKKNKITLHRASVDVVDGTASFNVEKDTDYFITYIDVKSIKASSIILDQGKEERIKVQYNPSNATNLGLTYKVENEKIAKITGGRVKALSPGTTTITIKSKSSGVTKDIKVTVNKVEEEVKPESKPAESTNKKTSKGYDIVEKDGITYIDDLMIVNKTYSLPSTYNPGGLTDEFNNAFEEMREAAANDGIELFVASGFRDYEYQVDLYNKYVNIDGPELADTYSARPGYSEHQTGLTADINSADESFEGTPEAIWLDKNCYKYGFIVRYPKGKDQYTGYEYEPWHLRYVGKEKAKKLYESGLSMEEYYGFTSEYEN